MNTTYTCTWGERLKLDTEHAGGLNPLVKLIDERVGPIGTRNTYAKLFELDGPPSDAKFRVRAALVISALGDDVSDWGIDPSDLPPLYRDAVDVRSPRHQEICPTPLAA